MIATTTNAPATKADKSEFHICDEASANWLLRKLANLDAERARVKAQAAEMLAQIDADESRLLDLYGAELEAFARETLGANGDRRRSLPLLQGTLAFRTVPAGLQLEDEAAALEAAQGLGCTRQTLDRAAYRAAAEKAMEDTGELLPGVVAVPARENFSVSFGRVSGAYGVGRGKGDADTGQ